jgi:hypothetical protein
VLVRLDLEIMALLAVQAGAQLVLVEELFLLEELEL